MIPEKLKSELRWVKDRPIFRLLHKGERTRFRENSIGEQPFRRNGRKEPPAFLEALPFLNGERDGLNQVFQ